LGDVDFVDRLGFVPDTIGSFVFLAVWDLQPAPLVMSKAGVL
jgi:hypothetical protein